MYPLPTARAEDGYRPCIQPGEFDTKHHYYMHGSNHPSVSGFGPRTSGSCAPPSRHSVDVYGPNGPTLADFAARSMSGSLSSLEEADQDDLDEGEDDEHEHGHGRHEDEDDEDDEEDDHGDRERYHNNNSGNPRAKRFRLTHNQTRFLMSQFAKQAHPDAAHRAWLSREIPGLTPRKVQVWFQNRRAKLKRLTADDRDRMMRAKSTPEEFVVPQAARYPSGQGYVVPPPARAHPLSASMSMSSQSRVSDASDESYCPSYGHRMAEMHPDLSHHAPPSNYYRSGSTHAEFAARRPEPRRANTSPRSNDGYQVYGHAAARGTHGAGHPGPAYRGQSSDSDLVQDGSEEEYALYQDRVSAARQRVYTGNEPQLYALNNLPPYDRFPALWQSR